MSMQTDNNKGGASRAFMKGLREIRVKDVQEVREAIYGILGAKSKQSFAYYAKGKAARLDVLKARQIESLFASYGVTDPWGE